MSHKNQQRYSRQNDRSTIPKECLDNLETIINDSNGTQKLVQCADDFGKNLAAAKLTTSQIRALFGEVRQIESQWKMGLQQSQNNEQSAVGEEQVRQAKRRLILLKPKMAYRARKKEQNGRGPLTDLVKVLDKAIDIVQESDDPNKSFFNFVSYFEAILAYHKGHGGKD